MRIQLILIVTAILNCTFPNLATAAHVSCIASFKDQVGGTSADEVTNLNESIEDLRRQIADAKISDPEFARHAQRVLEKLLVRANQLAAPSGSNRERTDTRAAGIKSASSLWVATTEITPYFNNRSAVFSPDGKKLLYFTPDGLTSFEYRTGKREVINTDAVPNAYHFQVSEGGRFALISHKPNWIETYVMDLISGKIVWHETYAGTAVMTPDGSMVAYRFGQNEGEFYIRNLLDPSSEAVRYDTPSGKEPSFSFTADKRSLRVLTHEENQSNLTTIDLHDGSRRTEVLKGFHVFTDENNVLKVDDEVNPDHQGANGWIERRDLDLSLKRKHQKLEIRRISSGELLQTIEVPQSTDYEFILSSDARAIAILPQNHQYRALNPPIVIYRNDGI